MRDCFCLSCGEELEESVYCRYDFHDCICFLKTYKNILLLEVGMLYVSGKMKLF